LLLELMIYEDSPNVAAARTAQSASQPTADDEDEDAPRLFAQPISRRRSGTLPQAELTRNSALLDAARSAGSRDDAIAAVAWLERGLPFVARADIGIWRLTIARSRLAAGQDAAAAADFVRLAKQRFARKRGTMRGLRTRSWAGSTWPPAGTRKQSAMRHCPPDCAKRWMPRYGG
jgi:hypothetical protein